MDGDRIHVVQVVSAPKAQGGVTEHVNALAEQLLGARGIGAAHVAPLRHLPHLILGRGSDVDVVHIHASQPNVWRLLGLAVLAIVGIRGPRLALTLHHGQVEETYSSVLAIGVLRLLALRTTFFALTDTLAEFLRARIGADPVRVSSLMRLPHLPPDRNVAPSVVVREPRVSGAQGVIVTSGYESADYRFPELVDACARLQGVELRIYTYGPSSPLMERVAAHASQVGVCMTHHRGLSHDAFLRELQEADVYVRNTVADSFGLAIAEAMVAGAAAVATDVCDRPAGTHTYGVDDFDGLVTLLEQLLARPVPPDVTGLQAEAKLNVDAHLLAYGRMVPGSTS